MTGTSALKRAGVEHYQEDILRRLRAAGRQGLTKAGLGLHSGVKRQAFAALIKSGEIVNLGHRTLHRWVLKEFDDPQGLAFETIEKNSHDGGLKLLVRQDLFKSLYGKIRAKAEKALDQLVKEGRIIILKRKSVPYFIHANHLKTALSDLQTVPKMKKTQVSALLERDRVLSAYRNIREATGFSNVEISRLRDELGVGLESLKAFIREECRQGRAIINPGDWSLSSDRVRAAAIIVRGVPHTYVRFDD